MTPRLPLSITLAQSDAPSDAPPSLPSGLQSSDTVAPPANAPAGAGDGNGAPADGTATTGQPGAAGNNQPLPPDDTSSSLFSPMLLLVVMALFFVMLFWGQHRDKKKKQQMLSAISKGDKVQTVGGIIGTVTDIKSEQITVKVDENTNTKMKFNRSAVQTILHSKDNGDTEDKEADKAK